jgi:hypothetical protein
MAWNTATSQQSTTNHIWTAPEINPDSRGDVQCMLCVYYKEVNMDKRLLPNYFQFLWMYFCFLLCETFFSASNINIVKFFVWIVY